jgi:hypothetical protein
MNPSVTTINATQLELEALLGTAVSAPPTVVTMPLAVVNIATSELSTGDGSPSAKRNKSGKFECTLCNKVCRSALPHLLLRLVVKVLVRHVLIASD